MIGSDAGVAEYRRSNVIILECLSVLSGLVFAPWPLDIDDAWYAFLIGTGQTVDPALRAFLIAVHGQHASSLCSSRRIRGRLRGISIVGVSAG